MKRKLSIFTRGIVRENPVLVLVLGTCSTLATSTQVSSALGMGMATALVLICSNMAISALKHVIPGQVRIPCYIVVIASFVTIVQMLIRAFVPALNDALGIYLPLIVVNCIILGRAEMFANKHSVLDAALDGAGMGAGFLLTLLVMASIREVFGNGTWYGMELPFLARHHVSILTMAPGGFCVFGLLIAAVNKLSRQHRRKQDELACSTCPAAAICGQQPSQEQEVADS
ncbi:MAG: electron transport complex subunit RsxE [Clostridiales bacterium]|jgi:electron transport complex protein RnfE|nr:electron transport complex subunit E [Oscillospiraceae bacterium]PWL91348.1 MAG: electron transport complex subunit RsxE [Clostridiales bacterium]